MSRDATVLVVDDEEGVRELVTDALRLAGYRAIEARDGYEALDLTATQRVDLVLIDVNMPGLDGFATLESLRAAGNDVPVILLTARGDRADVSAGFELGADDYVRKPFGVQELCFRVDALLRRSQRPALTTDVHTCGPLTVDRATFSVRRTGVVVPLSRTEFELVSYLVSNQDRVVPKRELLREIWGIDFRAETAVVETYISYIRKKLHTDQWNGIRTVRGVGYQVTPS